MNPAKLSPEEAKHHRTVADTKLRLSQIRSRIQMTTKSIVDLLDQRAKLIPGTPDHKAEAWTVLEQARIAQHWPLEPNSTFKVSDVEYLRQMEETWKRLNSKYLEVEHEIGDFNWKKNVGSLKD